MRGASPKKSFKVFDVVGTESTLSSRPDPASQTLTKLKIEALSPKKADGTRRKIAVPLVAGAASRIRRSSEIGMQTDETSAQRKAARLSRMQRDSARRSWSAAPSIFASLYVQWLRLLRRVQSRWIVLAITARTEDAVTDHRCRHPNIKSVDFVHEPDVDTGILND